MLVTRFGWRSVFLVNGPVGVLGFGLTLLFVMAPRRAPTRGLDLPAQASGIVALGTLTFAFVQASSWGWGSWPIGGALAVFVLATVTFLALERHEPHPMLPLTLFKEPTFSAANTVGIVLNFGFLGQLFVITLFFQQILGYTPLFAGLALMPETGVFVIGSILAGKVTSHLGPRLPMMMGLLFGGLGFFAMSQVQTTTDYALLCVMLIAIGFGTSFTMPAMTAAVMEAVPKERSGIAATVLNAGRQAGSALGVALLGSFVSNRRVFMPGMHLALIMAGGAFLVGCLLTLFCVVGRPKAAQDTDKEEPPLDERVPTGDSSELSRS